MSKVEKKKGYSAGRRVGEVNRQPNPLPSGDRTVKQPPVPKNIKSGGKRAR